MDPAQAPLLFFCAKKKKKKKTLQTEQGFHKPR